MNLMPKEYTIKESVKLIPSGFARNSVQNKRDKIVQNILDNKNLSSSFVIDDNMFYNIVDILYRKYFEYVLEHGDTWFYNQGKSYSLLSTFTCLYDLIYKSRNN